MSYYALTTKEFFDLKDRVAELEKKIAQLETERKRAAFKNGFMPPDCKVEKVRWRGLDE